MSAPDYIAIEGAIGVGKTTLARLLAERLGARQMFEAFEENPFLKGFYADRDRYAIKTELFFLLERYDQQQRKAMQPDLFESRLVSDYLFVKNRLFACLTLDSHELALYERIYEAVARDIPKPDVVVYLSAELDVLLERIQRRGRPYEADFDTEYLANVRRIYSDYFEHYDETPLLVVETSQINIAEEGSRHFEQLLSILREGFEGRMKYGSPGSLI